MKLAKKFAAATMLMQLPCGVALAEGPSIGQFELKTLESEAGYLEFQSQNAYAWGHTRRGGTLEDPAAGDYLYDENSATRMRNALEMEVGFSRYLKSRIGIEFEDERVDDPTSPFEANDFAGLKLTEIGGEVIAILFPRDGDGFGLGAVAEFENPILSAKDEPKKLILGPIFEVAKGPWFASLIPMAVHFFGGEPEDGEPRDNKWDFSYAAQVKYVFSERWELALEAYGTIDRIGSSGHRTEAGVAFGDFDQHRIGPVLYHTIALEPDAVAGTASGDGEGDGKGSELTIGLGFLAGLNENTPDGTLKLSLEVDF
jgi:hypothetical protein